MSNGQLNSISVKTVMQLVTQEPAAATSTSVDGAQQNSGEFAGLLEGIQLQAQVKTSSDAGHVEKTQDTSIKDLISPDAGEEVPVVDLLSLLQVSPQIITATASVAPIAANPEIKDCCADSVPLTSNRCEVTSQMAMTAYAQPGRMPEVSNPSALLPDDLLQKATTVTEQSGNFSILPVEKQTGRVTAETPPVLPVQCVEQSPLLPVTEVVASVPADAPQSAKSDRMSAVNKMTVLPVLPVDTQQNVVPIHAQQPIFSASTDKTDTVKAISEASQTQVTFSAVKVIVPETAEKTVTQRAGSVDLSPAPAEKPAAANTLQAEPLQASSKLQAEPPQAPGKLQAEPPQAPGKLQAEPLQAPGTLQPGQLQEASTLRSEQQAVSSRPQSELPLVHSTAPVKTSLPDAELEIQLSQHKPITARASATPVLADNRPAPLVQEIHGVRKWLNPEVQNEKVRTSTDQNIVKEMTQSVQMSATIAESNVGSDFSHSDSNQGQPGHASDNQLLAQDMRGQASAEHQKVTGTSKNVLTEPARQDIPEQVMHQVKERLGQYDVKQGNQQITLTLSPDSLGELKMNLNLQGQKLSVEIITENRTVRDAIVQHTDALKESLARQNITMESFDVTTNGKGSGNFGQNQNAWRELAKQQQQQQFWTAARGYTTAQAELPSGQAAFHRQQGQSMLDIHY